MAHGEERLAGFVPLPVLHGLTGGGGVWDEVLGFGLILGFLGVLAALSIRSGRKERKRIRKRRGRGKESEE